jgi:hypothetical protein
MSGIDEVDGVVSNRLEGELDSCNFGIIGVTSNSEDLV